MASTTGGPAASPSYHRRPRLLALATTVLALASLVVSHAGRHRKRQPLGGRRLDFRSRKLGRYHWRTNGGGGEGGGREVFVDRPSFIRPQLVGSPSLHLLRGGGSSGDEDDYDNGVDFVFEKGDRRNESTAAKDGRSVLREMLRSDGKEGESDLEGDPLRNLRLSEQEAESFESFLRRRGLESMERRRRKMMSRKSGAGGALPQESSDDSPPYLDTPQFWPNGSLQALNSDYKLTGRNRTLANGSILTEMDELKGRLNERGDAFDYLRYKPKEDKLWPGEPPFEDPEKLMRAGTEGGADVHGRPTPGGRFMRDEAIWGLIYRQPFYPPTERFNMDPYKWNKSWYPDMVPEVWNPGLKRYQRKIIRPLTGTNNAAEEIEPTTPDYEPKGRYVNWTVEELNYCIDDTIHPDEFRRGNSMMEFTGCGVIVCCDAYGLSPNLKQFCDRLCDNGFIVIMPDLVNGGMDFYKWPVNSTIEEKLHRRVENITWPQVVSRLDFAVNYLRGLRYCEQFALVGIGWGASVATRMAADKNFRCLCALHPTHVTTQLARYVDCPVLVVEGGEGISETTTEVLSALRENKNSHPVEYNRFNWTSNDFISGNADYFRAVEAEAAGEGSELVVSFLKKYMFKPPKEFHHEKLGSAIDAPQDELPDPKDEWREGYEKQGLI